jgi:hypothetical protein
MSAMPNEPNKVFAVITVARQIEGEYVFIKTEKAFATAAKADAYMRELKTQYTTPEGKSNPVSVTTQFGQAICMCEVGAFEMTIEE